MVRGVRQRRRVARRTVASIHSIYRLSANTGAHLADQVNRVLHLRLAENIRGNDQENRNENRSIGFERSAVSSYDRHREKTGGTRHATVANRDARNSLSRARIGIHALPLNDARATTTKITKRDAVSLLIGEELG